MDEAGKSGESGSLHGPADHAEPAGPQIRVFISYASHDAPVAQKVCSALEAAGFPCWIAPRDVVPGTLYADSIVGAIDESPILALILSAQAVASAHVGREIERAASKKHPIIVLKVDTAPLNRAFEYFLNQSQWIEVGAGGIDAAIVKLVETVGRHLAPGSAAALPQALAAPARKAATSRRVWILAAAFVTVALTTAYFLTDKAWVSNHSTAKGETPAASVVASNKSIAVLPFTDMSEKKDQEYFADGIAEELIGLLAQVPTLHVPARTSSFYFKGRQATMTEIARALGVSHVLEGSVRKSGDTMRITTQLIRADTGFTVWSHTYDRHIDDIFKVQDEIASTVMKSLKVSLLGTAGANSDVAGNSDAYILYLRARALNQRHTQIDNASAIVYLRRALQVDPMFAPAWSALADMLIDDFMYFAEKPYQETRNEAHVAADRALQIEPNLAAAHLVKGRLLYVIDWDFDAAELEISRALALGPNNSQTLRLASELATTMGHVDEALELAQRSVVNDPLDARGFSRIAGAQVGRNDLTGAEANFREAIELNPSAAVLHYLLASVLVARGDAARALEEAEREPDEAFRLASLALAFDALGRKEDADGPLNELRNKYAARSAYQIVEILAMRGELNGAFEWLERARRQHDVGLVKMLSNPLLKGLRGDVRFRTIIHKAKLPE